MIVAQLRQNRHGALPYVKGMHFSIGSKRQHNWNSAHAPHFRLHIDVACDAAHEVEAAHAHGLVELVHDEAQHAAGALLPQKELGLVPAQDVTTIQ